MSAIRLTFGATIKMREPFQKHAVKTVSTVGNLQAAISRLAHLVPGHEQRLTKGINQREWVLLPHGITMEMH
jgi:hypothetical protein